MNNDYRWLTELSQQFLDRDYLVDGQTTDERVTEICNAAESYLKKPGFAKKFKSYFQKGWYSFSTPVWTNFGNDRGLPISCVTGETWINTRDGGGKQARDIRVDDEVLTHKGRYRRITKVIETPNSDNIYRLKVSGRMTDLYLTGDHRVLTNLGWVRADELCPSKHLVATNRVVELGDSEYAIDLRPFTRHKSIEQEGRLWKAGSDRVRVDRRVEVVTYCASPFADVAVDEDVAWALGVWFAEGSLTVDADDRPNGIRITTNNTEEEKEVSHRWLQIMSDKFGVNGNSYDSEVMRHGNASSWYTTNLNSTTVGNYFASFGRGCKEKVLPTWVITLPEMKLRAFFNGFCFGDGSRRRDGSIKVTLANPKLLLQIYQIGLKLGLPMSLQMQDKAGKLASTTHVYTVHFSVENLSVARFSGRSAIPFVDGLSYAPIRNIELTNKTDTVYDFTVEEDHSFSAAGVVLHNCFGSYIADSMESIAGSWAEVCMMTKHGGGTSAFFGDLRERGAKIRKNGESSGSVHFMQAFDMLINIISQGKTRRGNFAAYLPIDHRDIMEFLMIRAEGFPIQDLSYGVCVPDYWMEQMIGDGTASGGDKEKRRVWAKVLEARANLGFPYIVFIDTVNRNTVDCYKDKGMRIRHSNLCSEIMLPNCTDESFVCDLSSMNDLYFDDWRHTDAVELMVYFLDAVMTEFINKASKIEFMHRTVKFAERHRALGIGQIGWHSYLQSKMIPFESMEAKLLNVTIAKTIKKQAYAASAKAALDYGEPDVCKGYGRRNSTLIAIAPTKSSAFILGQASECIEPHRTNHFIKDLQKGKYTVKNLQLEELLRGMGKDKDSVWDDILKHGGSVQHLDFLSEHEKAVFKTFSEISQKEVVIQAAQRQRYIDQSQSLNLMIHPSVPTKDVNALMIEGWKMGIKSYYYQYSVNAAQAFSRNVLQCVSCEG